MSVSLHPRLLCPVCFSNWRTETHVLCRGVHINDNITWQGMVMLLLLLLRVNERMMWLFHPRRPSRKYMLCILNSYFIYSNLIFIQIVSTTKRIYITYYGDCLDYYILFGEFGCFRYWVYFSSLIFPRQSGRWDLVSNPHPFPRMHVTQVSPQLDWWIRSLRIKELDRPYSPLQ